jgi:GH15 family glucan-1,4-alpha-glucosidase
MKLDGSDHEPISSYALISDSQGSALVSRGTSKDWACLPRFDSGLTFARLLDGRAGHWRISPAERFQVSRCYLDGNMVLRTTFVASTGSAAVTDAMPFRAWVDEATRSELHHPTRSCGSSRG